MFTRAPAWTYATQSDRASWLVLFCTRKQSPLGILHRFGIYCSVGSHSDLNSLIFFNLLPNIFWLLTPYIIYCIVFPLNFNNRFWLLTTVHLKQQEIHHFFNKHSKGAIEVIRPEYAWVSSRFMSTLWQSLHIHTQEDSYCYLTVICTFQLNYTLSVLVDWLK